MLILLHEILSRLPLQCLKAPPPPPLLLLETTLQLTSYLKPIVDHHQLGNTVFLSLSRYLPCTGYCWLFLVIFCIGLNEKKYNF